MTEVQRFAVVGQPIAHSKSPEIHAAFARQTGIALDYQRIEVAPAAFADTVREFFATGGSGLNVTLPHKLAAFALCQTLSQAALIAGAVNTLSADAGILAGENTDGVGLRRDLMRIATESGHVLAGQRVLVIGAGGAARGAVAGLIEAGLAQIVVAARDPARAQALVEQFPRQTQVVPLGQASDAARDPFDIVINASAAGLSGDVPQMDEVWFDGAWLAYDLSYSDDGRSPFLSHACARAVAHSVDGLGMLVEQAAESFFVWHGVKPAVAPVLAALRP